MNDFYHGLLGFSNWGGPYQTQGILAPGENIIGASPGSGTICQSGTSYATALVSGLVALLLSLELKRGRKADPLFVRAAIIESAIGCKQQPVPECDRLLAGRLNLPGVISRINQGAPTMTEESVEPQSLSRTPGQSSEAGLSSAGVTTATAEAGAAVQPAAADVTPTTGHADAPAPETSPPLMPSPRASDDPKRPRVEESAPFAQVTPSTCNSCGATGGGSTPAPQLVFAIGQLGYDFGTEARRDSFVQRMDGSPHDPTQLLANLRTNPWDSAALIWTLNLDATAIYAIQPGGAFASLTHERLREFLEGQLTEGVERVSIPGVVFGKAALLNGQVVPVIHPEIRGMYNWTTRALVEAVCQKPPAANASQSAKDAYAQKVRGVENFLKRVYDEFRNLGVTPQDRAMNYAATDAFQTHQVFEQCAKEALELDTIEVERSPICRPESDCWDVKLTFFDPTKRLERARHVHRFTVDVSDVVPCTVGEVRHWNVY